MHTYLRTELNWFQVFLDGHRQNKIQTSYVPVYNTSKTVVTPMQGGSKIKLKDGKIHR